MVLRIELLPAPNATVNRAVDHVITNLYPTVATVTHMNGLDGGIFLPNG